ncbi:MAG TPA: hypothetical protein VG895_01330 [Patescibacteria group bacterium]|nr:hypothetical protein [Patescibacteria group bacterium]
MITVSRYPDNPILKPNPTNPWESSAVFNGSICKINDNYNILYRAQGKKIFVKGAELSISVIGKAEGSDGINFSKNQIFIRGSEDWDQFGCEDPRVTEIDGEYFTFYTALSEFPFNANGIKAGLAISDDLKTVKEKHLVTPFNAKACALFPEKINDKYAVILATNTDLPPSKIAIAYFDKKEDIWDHEKWKDWYKNIDEHTLPLLWSNMDQVEVGSTPIKTPYGWLLIYCYVLDYFSPRRQFQIKGVLLDLNDPQKIVGAVKDAFLVPETDYELNGNAPNTIFPTSVIIENGTLSIYYSGADTTICLATVAMEELYSRIRINNVVPIHMEKLTGNPILTPEGGKEWEANGVLNPAAILLDGKTYLIYRAVDKNSVSRMGLAISTDGVKIDERLPDPIYSPREPEEKMGCEDPRVTLMDNKIYMCYTAYEGDNTVRVALTSITVEDFLNRKWDAWTKPELVTAPGIYDKDACLLPDKISDKYVFFHRITPGISIDKSESLTFGEGKWLATKSYIIPRKGMWDDEKIGIGPTPIKTTKGWLLIYHGISTIDHWYRAGAMLLDIKNPQLVDARTKYPILEPSEEWEKVNGRGIVFPCGVVEIGDYLYVYYGAADKNIGVARVKFSDLLDYLVNQSYRKFLKYK